MTTESLFARGKALAESEHGVLLPCPFCANPTPRLICLGDYEEPKHDGDYYVGCGKCPAQMCIGSGDKATAILDWNTRTAALEPQQGE